jgi:hypothetical protein
MTGIRFDQLSHAPTPVEPDSASARRAVAAFSRA